MQIGRIRSIGENVLGPGKRVGIWTRGCNRRCLFCMSTDLLSPDPACDLPLSLIAKLIIPIWHSDNFSGFTISGGEPLDQLPELLHLLHFLYPLHQDILLYSGYTFDELVTMMSFAQLEELQSMTSVWILGPYINERNNGNDPLRGSTNQSIHIRERFETKYTPLLSGKIQRSFECQMNRKNDGYIITGMIGGK